MTRHVVPVDDFIRDELYPGYTQACGTQPFADPLREQLRAGYEHFDNLAFYELAAMETDEWMWQVARRARDLGVADTLLEGDPSGLRQRLESHPQGRVWWEEFDEFPRVSSWSDRRDLCDRRTTVDRGSSTPYARFGSSARSRRHTTSMPPGNR